MGAFQGALKLNHELPELGGGMVVLKRNYSRCLAYF